MNTPTGTMHPPSSASSSPPVFAADWIEGVLMNADPAFTAGGATGFFEAIVSDSRKAGPRTVFVALQGENVDGHQFVEKALAQGATGFVVLRGSPAAAALRGRARLFEVADTLAAYRELAAAWRKRFGDIPVIAVAGSVGKTTTKELLHSLLEGRFGRGQVLKTEGSENGFVGIPLTLLKLRSHHRAAVVEIGIDEVGAMDQHIPLVQPTHSMLTAIAPEHLEKLVDLDTVEREEWITIDRTLALGGRAILNLEDPRIAARAAKLSGKGSHAFAWEASAAANRAEWTARFHPYRGEIEFTRGDWAGERFTAPLPGAHNALNLLGALRMAAAAGATPEEARRGLSGFTGAAGRSQLRSVGGVSVLCDWYNASPASIEAALAVVTELGARTPGARRWIVLGDMLELGPRELDFHAALSAGILAAGASGVLLYGPRMRSLQKALGSAGFSGVIEHAEAHEPLGSRLRELVRPGDLVLIKGSRGMKMEKVFESWQGSGA